MVSACKSDILNLITENIELFHSCDSVYLFGSTLNDSVLRNDVDILLVYSCALSEIVAETMRIRSVLEERLNLPVDLTVLNHNELEATSFLNMIVKYFKIK